MRITPVALYLGGIESLTNSLREYEGTRDTQSLILSCGRHSVFGGPPRTR